MAIVSFAALAYHADCIQPLGLSGGTAEERIYCYVPFLKEPFGNVNTIPVSLAPDAKLTRGGIHLCCELHLRNSQFEFSSERGNTRNLTPPIGISAFASGSHRYRHKPDHTPALVGSGRNEARCGLLVRKAGILGQRGQLP